MKKESLITKINALSATLPEQARDVFEMCLDLQSLHEKGGDIQPHEAEKLLEKAENIRDTLLNAMSTIENHKRLGTFLIEQGHVNAEQVFEALNRQRSLNKGIGQIAREEGLLSACQIIEILNAHPGFSRQFGEIAVQLGYLTTEQVERLYEMQMQQRPPLGEILVGMNLIDRATLQNALTKHAELRKVLLE